MIDRPLVDDGFRGEVLRRTPDAGRRWLDQLPQLADALCRRWRLEVVGPARAGATALVVPVTSGDRAAALKLISPVASAADEGAALEAFDGRGAARLFEADPESNALLIEWLPGPVLSTDPDPDATMMIAGSIAAELSRTPVPNGARSLAAGAADWKRQLNAQHQAATGAGIAFSDGLFAAALEVVDNLGRDRTGTLTHGDLSLSNIVRAESGRWAAIDPLLISGTAAHEAHTVVRSWLPTILDDADPAERMESLTREFASAAGVDPSAALQLSFARYVASAYWEAQNDGDRLNVRRLRDAAVIAERLL